MNSRYYVPVFANWEGEIVPTKLTNGTVAFYNPSFPPADAQTSPKLNATVPAFWMAIQAVTPLIHKGDNFVVLGEHSTTVSPEETGPAAPADIAKLDKAALPKVPFYSKFGVLYCMFGLGVFLYVARKK